MALKTLEHGGLTFRLIDEGQGEAVLLLHGFPDSRKVWRRQIPALVEAGYRVIAPDLRGFGESDKPSAAEAYQMATLVGDVVAILDELGIERTHLIGHDWGAALAWATAAFLPQRINSLAALSVGHPGAFHTSPIKQREKSWYMLLFQFPNAETLLSEKDWQLFRAFVRNHAETDRWIEALSKPGALTAALNWYRANVNPTVQAPPLPSVSVRTLCMWSTGDHYLTEESVSGSVKFMTAPWRYERIVEASHWLQLDRPDAINQLLLGFLDEV